MKRLFALILGMMACVGYASAQVTITYDNEAEWKA